MAKLFTYFVCFSPNGTEFRPKIVRKLIPMSNLGKKMVPFGPKLKKDLPRCRCLWKVDGWRKFLQSYSPFYYICFGRNGTKFRPKNIKNRQKRNLSNLGKKRVPFGSKLEMVFCYQNCSDLLWEKISKAINQTVKAQNNFW